MRRTGFKHIDKSQLRITRVALLLLFALVGVSLVFGMSGDSGRARMAEWLVPTPDAVWRHGKVWTLITGPLLEVRFLSLLFEAMMVWLFLPALERWWGAGRFTVFIVATALAGTVVGTLAGLALGSQVAVVGLNPTLFAAAVAFGMLYARQPVQFFGVLPMTGRQFMYGMIGLVAVFVLVGQEWEEGAAMAAAMLVAASLTSGRFDPVTAWRRRRFKKIRSHLSVVPPPPTATRRRGNTDERFLN